MGGRLVSAWRRRRAKKFIDLDKQVGIDFDFPSGPVHLDVRFRAEGRTLVMYIVNLQPVEALESGDALRRPVGVREVIRCRDTVARLAADAGYLRLRIEGHRRNHRRKHRQAVELDLG